ncbi:MAG: M4 family metallopeptidase [Saprospiraceae bacterium]|nr:M4 family metallopeptidase [Saprospiraceae bacterium]
MDKAIEIVFLLNTSYLHPTSDYHDVYENSKIVAEYLYGANSDEYNTVVNAWSAVGLPVVPIVYKDLALSVAINGNTDLNPFECYEPIKNMDFSINNISTVSIPPNTIMTLNVNGEYTIDNVSYNLFIGYSFIDHRLLAIGSKFTC